MRSHQYGPEQGWWRHKFPGRSLYYSACFVVLCLMGACAWGTVSLLPGSWQLLLEAVALVVQAGNIQNATGILIVVVLSIQVLAWPLSWIVLIWSEVALLRSLRGTREHTTAEHEFSRTWWGNRRAKRVDTEKLPASVDIKLGGAEAEQRTQEPALVIASKTLQEERSLEAMLATVPTPIVKPVAGARQDKRFSSFGGSESASLPALQFSGPQTPLRIEYRNVLRTRVSTGSDPGIMRQQQPNEDHLVAIQGTRIYPSQELPFGLFAVADGMGSRANGREASRLATQAILESVLPRLMNTDNLSEGALLEIMVAGVRQANRVIYQRNLKDGVDMGTTITACLVFTEKAYVVNVGDSRAYHYRVTPGLRQVTQDHSLVARLVAEGRLTVEETYSHPERNLIYRSLGEHARVAVDSFVAPLQAGDTLLLCSDGLWEMVRDLEIEQILSTCGSNPAQASTQLIQAALLHGGVDNVSVIVVNLV